MLVFFRGVEEGIGGSCVVNLGCLLNNWRPTAIEQRLSAESLSRHPHQDMPDLIC